MKRLVVDDVPAAPPRPSAGERLALVPGLRVVEAGLDGWQVGLRHPGRRRLPRTAAADLAVECLRAGAPLPDDGDVLDIAGELAESGLTAPAGSRRKPRNLAVEVRGRLGRDPTALIREAGLTTATASTPTYRRTVLLLQAGEPDRYVELPTLVRDRTPHLLVRAVDGVMVIGPFVVPGETACAHCVDLHAEDDDPGAIARTERYSAALQEPRDDGVADHVDPALAQLATAWAVRDLAAYADGERPASWSATIVVPPRLGRAAATVWLRHPHCGCSWF